MCVRFLLEAGIDELVRNYGARWAGENRDLYRTGDFFPKQSAPVVLEQRDRLITLGRWGFDYGPGKKVVANARAETLMDRPMFKDAARHARCIVPANLFYEWKAEDTGKKAMYRISLRDKGLISLGGIYKLTFLQGVGPQLSFVIITTDAEEGVREVHPRMPLIIKREWMDVWLNKDTPVDVVEEILRTQIGLKFAVEECRDEAGTGQPEKGVYGRQISMFENSF